MITCTTFLVQVTMSFGTTSYCWVLPLGTTKTNELSREGGAEGVRVTWFLIVKYQLSLLAMLSPLSQPP